MNNMLLRALTGAVYVALIVVCTLAGTEWFTLLVLALGLLAVNELQGLLSRAARIPMCSRLLNALMAVLVIVSMYTLMSNPATGLHDTVAVTLTWLASLLIVLYVPLQMIIAVSSRAEHAGRAFFYSTGALVYILLPLTILETAYFIIGKYLILSTFVLIWLNDTGAYLSGRTLGRHKLCERLSPKKTWEGFWGGALACILGGAAAGWLIYGNVTSIVTMACYGIVVSVLSTYGDLFESLIKRSLGVKDSGNLIPGHGGILDRIDSLLAVASVTVLLFMLALGNSGIFSMI